MDLTLTRIEYRVDGIFGEIHDDKGNFAFTTLEHAYLVGPEVAYEPKIPAGSYTCKRRLSPKFGYDVFELVDVPGHDFIEIHIGNYNEDSDGCILVGLGLGFKLGGKSKMITNSGAAFKKLMQLQENIDEFKLTIS